MHLTVKGKNLDVGNALRSHVEEFLNHTAGKYFRDPIEANVVFSKEKQHYFKADISIHVGGGILVQTHHEAGDPYVAFDTAAKAAGKRLGRYKDRLRDHRKNEPDALAAQYTTFAGEEPKAEGGTEPAIVAEMQTQILTLAVSDAVMRLELGNMPVLLFRNPRHGGINLVYRRKDGNIGWVDPESNANKAAPKKPSAKVAKSAKPALKKKPANKSKAPAAKKKARAR